MVRRRVVLLLTLMTAIVIMVASPAWARDFTVNSLTDRKDNNLSDGSCSTGFFLVGIGTECSLRAAIEQANVNGETDKITFDPTLSGTITLFFFDELQIANDNPGNDLIIEGPGASKLTVSGNDDSQVFKISSSANVTISGLTISRGNVTAVTGGGIFNGGTLTLTNSTVSSNTASTEGGGGISNVGTLTLTNSTVSGNTASTEGGGITNAIGGLTLTNTIIAANTANTRPDASGTFASQGNNLIGDISGSSGWIASDLLNLNPLLGPLQNNGGPTNTHVLLPGSRAVDAGANTACPPTDQRGVARQDGDQNGTVICDIGAFERNDLITPRVTDTSPDAGQTGVKRVTNLSATFSETMDRTTINKSTFKLYRIRRDSTLTQVTNGTVRSTTDGLKAILNPFGTSTTVLAANTRYRAVVTTGAKDRAGNRLDQNRTLSGYQPKVWTFTTGSS